MNVRVFFVTKVVAELVSDKRLLLLLGIRILFRAKEERAVKDTSRIPTNNQVSRIIVSACERFGYSIWESDRNNTRYLLFIQYTCARNRPYVFAEATYSSTLFNFLIRSFRLTCPQCAHTSVAREREREIDQRTGFAITRSKLFPCDRRIAF